MAFRWCSLNVCENAFFSQNALLPSPSSVMFSKQRIKTLLQPWHKILYMAPSPNRRNRKNSQQAGRQNPISLPSPVWLGRKRENCTRVLNWRYHEELHQCKELNPGTMESYDPILFSAITHKFPYEGIQWPTYSVNAQQVWYIGIKIKYGLIWKLWYCSIMIPEMNEQHKTLWLIHQQHQILLCAALQLIFSLKSKKRNKLLRWPAEQGLNPLEIGNHSMWKIGSSQPKTRKQARNNCDRSTLHWFQ